MKKRLSMMIALSISLFIYVFYRSDKTFVNELIILVSSAETYGAIKTNVAHAIPLNRLVVFSLPGGLWIFCATALSENYYVSIRNHAMPLGLIPILFAIGLEFCQMIHLTHGRFDVWDIVIYIMFWLLACYLNPRRCPQQNILSPFYIS